jgi:hypothetical protein
VNERALIRVAAAGLLGGLALACASATTGAGGSPGDDDRSRTSITGPAPYDCDGRREQARVKGYRFAPFFIELTCRVHPIWTCPSFCQGRDELFVSQITARIDRAGQLVSSQTKKGSGQADYDELNLAALRAGAPFAAPPVQMVDGTGNLPITVEFSCDCRK